MKVLSLATGAMFLLISGCSAGSNAPVVPPAAPAAIRAYNGTASVGDFLALTLDPNNKTIAYKNISNGDTGTVTYAVKNDGTYAINDPSGNLVSAYEVPNYALMIDVKKAGPDHNTMALVTGVASTPISIADGFTTSFNYLQFRTSQGGLEIGCAGMDSQGNITISTYWPFGAYYMGVPFQAGTFGGSSIQQDHSGNFLKVVDAAGQVSYVFGTANAFVADRPDGTMLGFNKAVSKNFDPTFTGTYNTSLFQKSGASSNQGDVESGSPSFDHGSLILSSDGKVTITNSHKQVLAEGMLVPVADVPELYNGGIFSLGDPCFGLFTFRATTPTSQQDVYVGFQGKSVAFASFKTAQPQDRSKPYDYFYGVAVQ